MKWIKFPNQKITFESFLSSIPARDYIYQDTAYDQQIRDAAKMIRNAEYVLIGVGAGMSTAAGAQYGGKFFEENFGEFQKKYGKGPYMQDMYFVGFYKSMVDQDRAPVVICDLKHEIIYMNPAAVNSYEKRGGDNETL